MKHTIDAYTRADLEAALRSENFKPVEYLQIATELAKRIAETKTNQKIESEGAKTNGR